MAESEKKWLNAVIGLAVAWLAYSIYMIVFVLTSWSERGTFGDTFGSFNALFSALALGGIIYTIFLQRRELALQRQELSLTRQELQRTASAQEKSEEALREQHRAMLMTAWLNAANTVIEVDLREIEDLKSVSLSVNEAKQRDKQVKMLEDRVGALRRSLTSHLISLSQELNKIEGQEQAEGETRIARDSG